MTRTTHWRSQTPLGQSRQANHGHKRKGKPVEALMMELERENEENGSQHLDLSAIEQIANGVERMVFSWDLDKEGRGQEYAKVSKSLAKDTAQMVLPWSPKKNEDTNSCSHSDNARNNNQYLSIAQLSRSSNPSATFPHQSVARAHSPKTHTSSPPTVQYPASVESQKEGTLEGAIACGHMSDMGSSRESSDVNIKGGEEEEPMSGYIASKNTLHPSLVTGDCNRQSTLEFEFRRRSFGSNQEVLMSNNLLINTNRAREEETQVVEKREREDSTCEQESSAGCTHLEVNTNDGMVQVVTSGQSTVSTTNDDNDGEDAKCGNEIASKFSLKGEAHVRGIQSNNTDPMHIEGDQFPASPVRVEHARDQSPPLLSQSPLYVRQNDAIYRGEILNENGLVMPDGHVLRDGHVHKNGSRGGSTNPRLSTYLDPSPRSPRCQSDTETVEVGGHAVKITSLRNTSAILENKFQTLINISPVISRLDEHSSTPPSTNAELEDLQIALLECAMEYEIKTIETKMKMQEIILQERQNLVVAKCEQPCLERALEVTPNDRILEYQRLQQIKKQVVKLQHEKDALSKELSSLKKKERQFERQKRSLEDALHRVNRLQREVVKKDQEVVEWQLKEKETKVQLQEVADKLRKAYNAQALEQMEPKRLLTLLPALREWLRSLKKVGTSTKVVEHRPFYQECNEVELVHPMDGYILQPPALGREKMDLPAHLGPLGQLSDQLANRPDSKLSIPQVDVIICCLTREIQALQTELSKLARG